MQTKLQRIAAMGAALGRDSAAVAAFDLLPESSEAGEVALRDEAALPIHSGEFREAQHAYLLPGVLSTRMWIKQANYAAETLLERWVEPWEALFWALDQATGASDWEQTLRIDSAAPFQD